MAQSDLSAVLRSIEDLLDVESHAIRHGVFDGLDRMAEEKSRLLETIRATVEPPKSAALLRLKRKADANQRLLAAALKGVRAARIRLDMILHASRSLNSYDSLGRAKTIGGTSGTIERRA